MTCPLHHQSRTSSPVNGTLAAISLEDRTTGLPELMPPYGPSMPVMHSRRLVFGSAAIAPDFTAMRRHRDEDSISIRQLQALRGVEPSDQGQHGDEDTHQQLMEAYGYRQLTEGLFAALRFATSIPGWLAAAIPDIPLGPRVCAAAPSRSALDSLLRGLASDVDYWISPAARDAADTRGLLIIFGEDHYDASVLRLGMRLMRAFRAARGDRFFMEGTEDWICKERESLYRLRSGSCRLLEKDAGIDEQFRAIEVPLDRRLTDCLAYLATHVPGAPPPPGVNEELAVGAYFKRWLPRLPAAAREGFSVLKREYDHVRRAVSELLETTSAQRDQQMADVLKRDIGPGWNFAIVGANHLQGLRQRLVTLPSVFLVPRMLVATDPTLRLRAMDKDEL